MSEDLVDILPVYYSRIFPVDFMYRWLSYGKESMFSHREFSFTLPGDVYIRYQSFPNKEDFGKQLRRKRPEKIDIGAVYNVRPNQRESALDFQPIEKEFVLDIDLTDYDDVRICCDGANVCKKCWKFIAVGVEILDKALRDDFGFKHLLWVFSGRRGVHCWVSDENARNLDNTARGAVIEYLTVVVGGENQSKKVKLGQHVHPSLARACKIIKDHFKTICLEEQDIFGKKYDHRLEIFPDKLKEEMKREETSFERWNALLNWTKENVTKKRHIVEQETYLQYCYPRLDINVSKGLNHLLKSPFCVHPKTGKICVPFEAKNAHSFDVMAVPTLLSVIDEINQHDAANANSANIADWKKTSLLKYMKVFTDFVKQLERKEALNSELF